MKEEWNLVVQGTSLFLLISIQLLRLTFIAKEKVGG
jgi:hypothetical protein